MTRLNLSAALVCAGVLLASGTPICPPAQAQATQPPPPAVPVPAVDGAALSGPAGPALAGQTVEGTARVVDGDEILVGDKPVRLYGIAAPDLSAPFGPAARLALDALAEGQRVTCQAFDRDRDGTTVARCLRGSEDLGEQLLAQGLAAVYRASQNPTPAERDIALRYDAAEAEARGRGVGLWLKAPAPKPEAAPEPLRLTRPELLGLAGPLGGALIVALAILLAGGSRRRHRQREKQAAAAAALQDVRTLTAILSSEILAIRAAAEAQHQQTAELAQDQPLPAAQLALLGLPPAKVYEANAGRLHILPREVSVDLVQFYAQHASVARLIGQAAALRCDTLRAALKGLVDAAVQPMKQAEKVLGQA